MTLDRAMAITAGPLHRRHRNILVRLMWSDRHGRGVVTSLWWLGRKVVARPRCLGRRMVARL